MRDELVKRLKEPCQYENCILCQQAADAIEELVSNADKLKWIPVTERLPEENANYLTYGVFLPLGVKAMDLCRFNGKGWMIDQNVKITHWMELPKPPKEDDNA